MLSPICCDNPLVIVNKAAQPLVDLFGSYYFEGSYRFGSKIPPAKYVDKFKVDGCYVFNALGEKIPLYYLVPCGHCALCCDRQKRHLAFRFEAETAKYCTHKPLFATFTYKPKCRPRGIRYKTKVIKWTEYVIDSSGQINAFEREMTFKLPYYTFIGVSARDLTLFFKKFRNKLYSEGLPCDFRYYYCAEYGTDPTKSHAPHYHVVFWNLPEPDYFADNFPLWKWLSTLEHWMRSCWRRGYNKHLKQLGIVQLEIVGESKKRKDKLSGSASGTARYVSKYVGKKYCPIGMNKPFVHCSTRNGGIGMSWIRENVQRYRSNIIDNRCAVSNPWTHEKTSCTLPPQYIHYAFPTLSQLVPKKVRDAYQTFQTAWNTFRYVQNHYIERVDFAKYDYLYDKFRYLSTIDSRLFDRKVKAACLSASNWDFPFAHDSRDDNYYQTLDRLQRMIDNALITLDAFDYSPDYIEMMLNYKKGRTAYIKTLTKRVYDTTILEYSARKHAEKLESERFF